MQLGLAMESYSTDFRKRGGLSDLLTLLTLLTLLSEYIEVSASSVLPGRGPIFLRL